MKLSSHHSFQVSLTAGGEREPAVRDLPEDDQLRRAGGGRVGRAAVAQRPLCPLPEHHQREDLPPPLVLPGMNEAVICLVLWLPFARPKILLLPDLRYYCWMQPWKRKCQSFPNHCLPRCSCSSCPSSSSSTASARCSSSQSGSTSSTRAYTTQRYIYFIEYYTYIYSSNIKEQQVIPFVQLTHSETSHWLFVAIAS